MSTLTNEHPFAQYVRILGKGKTGSRSLSREQARTAFAMILAGQARPEQIGAFLMLLRVKEESAEELAGFVEAARDLIQAPDDITVDIDWSSYAGKRQQLPWFIACLLLLADHGYRVLVHGARGHTEGRLYCEDAFVALGLPVARNWHDVAAQLDSERLSFLPIDALCPPLQQLIDMRSLFGLRSPVHTLCRLLNPLNAPYSLQSVFHPAYADSHQQAAALLGQANMAVFKGEGGEIERKPGADCLVKSLVDHSPGQEKWPRLDHGRSDDEAQLDSRLLAAVWNRQQPHAYADDAVPGTLAVVLKLIKPQLDQPSALAEARQMWQQRRPRHFTAGA